MRLLDDSSAALRGELDQWLSLDPRNAVAYARIARAWEKAGALSSIAPPPDHHDRPPSPHPGEEGCDQQ